MAFGLRELVKLAMKPNQRFISPLICGGLLFILGVFGFQLFLADGQQRPSGTNMQRVITRKRIPAFTIIGIEARTNNVKESTADGAIPKQWQRFFADAIPAQIPNKTGQNFYAVYTDYASDHNGDYTYIVGAPVKEGTAPPSGMVLKQIPSGEYVVVTTDRGPFAKVVPAAWQHIFQLEDEGKLKRAYNTDFEIYDQRAQYPQNAQVDIYTGVK